LQKLDIEFQMMMRRLKNEKPARFATIDPDYVTGRPRLIYDGEQTPTIKTFVYLDSYTPVASERVMVIQNVIIGKLN